VAPHPVRWPRLPGQNRDSDAAGTGEVRRLEFPVIDEDMLDQRRQASGYQYLVAPGAPEAAPEGVRMHRVAQDGVHADVVLVPRELDVPDLFLLSL
jgi:hypothetical protein